MTPFVASFAFFVRLSISVGRVFFSLVDYIYNHHSGSFVLLFCPLCPWIVCLTLVRSSRLFRAVSPAPVTSPARCYHFVNSQNSQLKTINSIFRLSRLFGSGIVVSWPCLQHFYHYSACSQLVCHMRLLPVRICANNVVFGYLKLHHRVVVCCTFVGCIFVVNFSCWFGC